jgi:hypothetical protein
MVGKPSTSGVVCARGGGSGGGSGWMGFVTVMLGGGHPVTKEEIWAHWTAGPMEEKGVVGECYVICVHSSPGYVTERGRKHNHGGGGGRGGGAWRGSQSAQGRSQGTWSEEGMGGRQPICVDCCSPSQGSARATNTIGHYGPCDRPCDRAAPTTFSLAAAVGAAAVAAALTYLHGMSWLSGARLLLSKR